MSPKRLAGHAVTVEVVDVTSDHAEVAGCDVRAVEGVVHDGDAGAGLVAVVGVVICERDSRHRDGAFAVSAGREQHLCLQLRLDCLARSDRGHGPCPPSRFHHTPTAAFYSWIIGLATAIAAALPFAEDAGTDA